MEIVRWGMIGVGDVAERKSGPAFSRVPRSRLQAVAARRVDRARDYALRHKVPVVHESIEALLADPGIDAVYIATPPDAHESLTLQAAAAGKPVYVEKPMARTHAECLRMVEACHAARVSLSVAYYRRRLPKFMRVKELLAQGAIGRIQRADLALHTPFGPTDPAALPWRLQPEIAGPGGHLMDLGTHQVDLLAYLMGPVERAVRKAVFPPRGLPVPDRISAHLDLAGGIPVEADWRFDVAKEDKVDRTTIIGSDGSIAFSTFDDVALTLTNSDGVQREDLPNPAFVQEPMIHAVVEFLLGSAPNPCDGDAGARANQTIESILDRD